MSSNNIYQSDLYKIHNVVQSSMLVYPKEIIIATLREFFSRDSYYHYSKDQWGFANTTDHTDLPPGADLPYGPGARPDLSPTDILSTRVFIGEQYRYDGIYYPAILVKGGSSKYVPISINREKGGIQYETIVVEDGYGNQTTVSKPASFITAGIWEGNISIDVLTRSLRSRDDLVELIAICFTEINFETLEDIGIIIKPINIGAPSESDDRNDKLFRQTITLDIRTEWRRLIPISNIIDAILFTVNFVDLSRPEAAVAQNLEINNIDSITDVLINI
jgi:hypothetical protein